MSEKMSQQSRTHDLLAAVIGGFALITLLTAGWNVDTSGPDPFYKGPLLFPVLVLSFMVISALPAIRRLIWPATGVKWYLDGNGLPVKTMWILVFLIAALFGFSIIGLEASTALFLMGALHFMGVRGLFQGVGLPLLLTLVIVLVFKLFLDVWFPEPLFLNWMGG
ncbi:MAG: hypothetical protein HKM93_19170 [Desulfobacteraceae bacterium]|nr:hypothetical protein [Desulfobacteraceae bacterium]